MNKLRDLKIRLDASGLVRLRFEIDPKCLATRRKLNSKRARDPDDIRRFRRIQTVIEIAVVTTDFELGLICASDSHDSHQTAEVLFIRATCPKLDRYEIGWA